MSYADKVFKDTCKEILENGVSSENENVRAKWEDGTPAHTIKKFGVVNRYDLRKEFPIMTLRKTNFKNCIDEILWIYQKKSNQIKELNSHIWDHWAKDGSIGKAYGYQLGIKHHYPEGDFDQVDKVLYDLKNNSFSRRIMTNMYNHHDLSEMSLYPCAYSLTFNVTRENGRLVLNAILNQRSQDMLTANGWNVTQYAILLYMFALSTGMIAGELVHVIADAHIYTKHIDFIKEMMERPEIKAPKLFVNPTKKDFYDFTVDDFILVNYQYHDNFKFPVAI